MPRTELDKNMDLSDTVVSSDSFPVTPSDTVNLSRSVRALRCNTGGIVHVTTAAGVERYMNFADSETKYVAILKVWAAGTTASGIEGMP